MKTFQHLFLILSVITGIAGCSGNNTEVDKRISYLISQMSLEEKVGQMTMICLSNITANGDKSLTLNPDSALKAIVNYNIGSFISGAGNFKEWKDFVTKLQQIAISQSRNKIPLLIAIDHVHGANYITEGTILPHNLILSCSFDTSLVRSCAALTASETMEAGIRWNLSPVLDLGKNAYWPRLYETFGEDPLVCSAFGTAYISGIQKDSLGKLSGLAACGKHFIGYSDPKSGWDRTPAEISDQNLFEFFVPPFREAINSGLLSIMLNSGEVNGIPVHASPAMVNDLLKGYLGFGGVVVTDIKDIQKIVSMHKFATDEKEATLLAINAGIDISMACSTYDFIRYTLELVHEGKISEQRINQSVEKILRFKEILGLFENPFPIDTPEMKSVLKMHRETARFAAEASIVLLKNEGILPLNKTIANIAVTGFAANSKANLNGGWTFDWGGAPEDHQPKEMLTILEALKLDYPESNVYEILSSPEINKNTSQLFHNADVIILTIGEKPYSEFKGNINDLALDPEQDEWTRKVLSFGKPVILILVEGRPRLITNYADKADAILFAGLPGMKGADALSGILSGRVSPSGHLSFSYPLAAGHVTPYYQKYSDESTDLYPFGYGLSYTHFRYSDLQISDSMFYSPSDALTTSITVTNTGEMEGKDVVLWYLGYPNGHITRPLKILKKFDKVSLKPGETETLVFKIIPEEHFTFPDEKGNMILPKGNYKLFCEGSSVTMHLH